MTNEEAINYLKSSGMSEEQIKAVIDAFTCADCISRQAAEDAIANTMVNCESLGYAMAYEILCELPSVTPKFTDTEIQKMQELEQAQLEKAYELGKAETQPCDDCISREALLTSLEKPMNWTDSEAELQEQRDYEGFIELIKSMPSVTPKVKWIPVTERLPEKSGKYLVTVKNGNVYAGTYDAFSGRFQCAATAWQPLPQPYKAEEERGEE